MNNPVAFVLNGMLNGGNPRAMIGQLAQQDPRAQMVMQMMQGKSGPALEQFVRNTARTKGVDLDMFAQQMGVHIPNNR